MADLTTVANVKAVHPVQGTGADPALAQLIIAASAFFQTVTRRKFDGVASFSEIRDGSGGTELYLAKAPDVTAITTLTVDARPITAQPADGQPGYFVVDASVLCLWGHYFTRGRKNVRVAYSYGFSAVPKDVEQAVIELVLSAYARDSRGVDRRSESNEVGKVTTSFDLKDCPAFAARVIQEYRRVVPL